MVSKFYDFKNKADNNIDIYVYGEIIGGSDKWDESDVTFQDFKDQLEGLTGNETINMYINSIGGSIFATQGIMAMLQRAKDKGVIVNATIDGLAASCASWLCLVADNVYTYKSSIMMVHHAMSMAFGNVNDLQAQIEVLNKIENSVMIPTYMSKAKDGINEDKIKELIDKETWLDATEMSEIFDIIILEEDKELVACVQDKSILNKYKNIPHDLVEKLDEKEVHNEPQNENTTELELAKAKLRLLTL